LALIGPTSADAKAGLLADLLAGKVSKVSQQLITPGAHPPPRAIAQAVLELWRVHRGAAA